MPRTIGLEILEFFKNNCIIPDFGAYIGKNISKASNLPGTFFVMPRHKKGLKDRAEGGVTLPRGAVTLTRGDLTLHREL